MITLTWSEWVKQYRPIKNEIAGNPQNAFEGYMFETYGKEYDYLRSIAQENPNKVWTLLSEGNTVWIGNGFHFVNQLGHLVTEVPFLDEDEFVVEEDRWEDEMV